MTDTQRPNVAPFCWGQAACFRADAKRCETCPHNVECVRVVLERLGEISKEVNVSPLIVSARAFLDKRGVIVDVQESTDVKVRMASAVSINFDTTDVEALTEGLAIRAKKIAVAMAKKGINMSADAQRNTNSMRSIRFKPEYMADIQDMVNQNKEFTREMVKEAIANGKEMKSSLLNNSCSFAISAMKALGFITEIGQGKYVIN